MANKPRPLTSYKAMNDWVIPPPDVIIASMIIITMSCSKSTPIAMRELSVCNSPASEKILTTIIVLLNTNTMAKKAAVDSLKPSAEAMK